MRRYSIWFISLVTLICLTGVYLYLQKDVFLQSPFNGEFAFEDISYATADEEGNLYVINKEKQQMIKLSSLGIVQFQYENVDKNKPFHYEDIIVDKMGRLHALKVDFLPYSDRIRSESIVRYHPDGTFDKILYLIEHSEEKITKKTINKLQFNRDNLHFLSIDDEKIYSNTFYPTSEVLETTHVAQIPEKHYLYEIVGGAAQSIVYSTKRGELYELNAGKASLLYRNEEGEIGRGVVERLSSGLKHDLYFFDQHGNEVVRFLLEDGSESIFLNRDVIGAQGYSFSLANIQSISKLANGSTIISQPNRIITFDQMGKIETVYERGIYAQEHRLFQWWIWFLPVVFIGLCLYTLRFFYLYILDRKLTLLMKQAMLFASLFTLSLAVFTYIIYDNFSKKVEEETASKLMTVADLLERNLSGDHLLKLMTPNDYMNDEYLALRNELNIEEEINSFIYKFQNGNLYAVLDERRAFFLPVAFTANSEAVLNGKRIFLEAEHTSLRPLYSRSGEVIGQFEISANKHLLQKAQDEFLSLLSKYIVTTVVIGIIIFTTITAYMLHPIRKLGSVVSEIAKGKWETAVSIDSSDEVAHLGEQVNKMSEHVSKYSKKMTDLNQAYYRFVPQLFLQYLGKDTVLDLQLGDQTEQEKTILILRMRSFYSFSKNLTPEENFKFINSFLSRFSPIIQQNEGLVNKYISAGALSFFPHDSKQAVLSAIQMRDVLITYNKHRAKMNYSPIDIGIGIHKGPIMLGVIGEKDRLEGAVISDDVNLTEMLEGISGALGVSILVTQSVIDDLGETEGYRYRNLGIVNVSERDEPIQLYDVYQGDPEMIRQLKEDTKALFEKGVIMYQDGRFSDARANFIEVIKKNPMDKTAKQYFYLCDEYYQKGTPKDWNGTLVIK